MQPSADPGEQARENLHAVPCCIASAHQSQPKYASAIEFPRKQGNASGCDKFWWGMHFIGGSSCLQEDRCLMQRCKVCCTACFGLEDDEAAVPRRGLLTCLACCRLQLHGVLVKELELFLSERPLACRTAVPTVTIIAKGEATLLPLIHT